MPRKALDGAKLAKDVTRLLGEDQVSPPAARPSLMDAVRALAGYIETRARLGWTDPMIAAVLRQTGYEISADTLRSYRKRLRDEGLMAPCVPGGQPVKALAVDAIVAAASPTPAIGVTPATADAAEPLIAITGDHDPSAINTPAPSVKLPEQSSAPRAPPAPPAPRRSFSIDPSLRPPDQA